MIQDAPNGDPLIQDAPNGDVQIPDALNGDAPILDAPNGHALFQDVPKRVLTKYIKFNYVGRGGCRNMTLYITNSSVVSSLQGEGTFQDASDTSL